MISGACILLMLELCPPTPGVLHTILITRTTSVSATEASRSNRNYSLRQEVLLREDAAIGVVCKPSVTHTFSVCSASDKNAGLRTKITYLDLTTMNVHWICFSARQELKGDVKQINEVGAI